MSFILFHSRKLLASCDVDKDCLGSECCRDSRCTSECGVDILPYISFYFVLLGLFFMSWICFCVCRRRIKNAFATRRTDRLQPFIQYMVLYYAEMSRAEEFLNSIQHPVDPAEHAVDPPEYSIDPQECPADPPEYSVVPPEYSVDPPGYSFDPPDYSADAPRTSFTQPPSYFV